MLVAVLATVFTVTLAVHLLSTALAWPRAARERGPDAPARPPVSLVRPVCGLDVFDAETLASSFGQDYPDHEILFCAASANDPAVALLEKLIADHPEAQARILIGDDRISANPKLNNLVKGFAAARGDWVAMTDANLLLKPDYLSRLDATRRADTGLVSSPPAGIRPGNFWGALECAFLNSNQARWQLAADALGIGFAHGKTLFWNRDLLSAGGGLEALARDLAEDVASTKLVRGQGKKVRLARTLFGQPIGKRDFDEVWGRQLRWSRIRRAGFPAIFGLEILQGPLPPLLALVALVGLGTVPGPALAAFAVLWYGVELALARAHGWPAAPRDIAAMLLRDALLPALWIVTWRRRGFTWRGSVVGA
jgi:ceramide glucosyltransferase